MSVVPSAHSSQSGAQDLSRGSNLAFLRCDFRFVGDATGRDVHYGFRLVLSR